MKKQNNTFLLTLILLLVLTIAGVCYKMYLEKNTPTLIQTNNTAVTTTSNSDKIDAETEKNTDKLEAKNDTSDKNIIKLPMYGFELMLPVLNADEDYITREDVNDEDILVIVNALENDVLNLFVSTIDSYEEYIATADGPTGVELCRNNKYVLEASMVQTATDGNEKANALIKEINASVLGNNNICTSTDIK